MAPCDGIRSRSNTRAAAAAKAKAITKPRRVQQQYKKQKQKQKHRQPNNNTNTNTSIVEEYLLPPTASITTSSTTLEDDHGNYDDLDLNILDSSSSGCCTPTAQRFRIPQIETCPPAPKKQRVVSNCTSNSILHRNPSNSSSRPIAFFAPPDLELFFFYALRNISV